jgi:hypothetical protein
VIISPPYIVGQEPVDRIAERPDDAALPADGGAVCHDDCDVDARMSDALVQEVMTCRTRRCAA